jgi:hypothetical protein
MRRQAVLLLLITLAGCASGPQDNSPEAVCQRQAYDDPKVKALIVQRLGWTSTDPNLDFQTTNALHDATEKCLLSKGIATRGGVQPVRPSF